MVLADGREGALGFGGVVFAVPIPNLGASFRFDPKQWLSARYRGTLGAHKRAFADAARSDGEGDETRSTLET